LPGLYEQLHGLPGAAGQAGTEEDLRHPGEQREVRQLQGHRWPAGPYLLVFRAKKSPARAESRVVMDWLCDRRLAVLPYQLRYETGPELGIHSSFQSIYALLQECEVRSGALQTLLTGPIIHPLSDLGSP
jgi:hypothetical protein